MANTYSSLYYHIIFSTKNRVKSIQPEIEKRVWAYIGGVARKHRVTALQVGGIEDHIHALVMAPPTMAPSQMAQFWKGDSSKWIHQEFPALRELAWQDGYGAFTVSKSNLSEVIHYIENQREHHRKKTFQESIGNFCRSTGLNTTNAICGDESIVAGATEQTVTLSRP